MECVSNVCLKVTVHAACAGLTVLTEALTNFGLLWHLAVPLGLGLLLLMGERLPGELLYFLVLPAALADCLCHTATNPAQLMRGPLVLLLKGALSSCALPRIHSGDNQNNRCV